MYQCSQLQEVTIQVQSGLCHRKFIDLCNWKPRGRLYSQGDVIQIELRLLCFCSAFPPAGWFHPPAGSEMSPEFSGLTPVCNHVEKKKETIFPLVFFWEAFLQSHQQLPLRFTGQHYIFVSYSQTTRSHALVD